MGQGLRDPRRIEPEGLLRDLHERARCSGRFTGPATHSNVFRSIGPDAVVVMSRQGSPVALLPRPQVESPRSDRTRSRCARSVPAVEHGAFSATWDGGVERGRRYPPPIPSPIPRLPG